MPDGHATILLRRVQDGDSKAVRELLPLVYDELRGLAAVQLRNERAGHTLQATALVHEAFLKLVGTDRMDWRGRSHFCGVASQAIRRILVDHARGKGRIKRGGDRDRAEFDEGMVQVEGLGASDIVGLDDALEKLSQRNERHARVVELKFFGGLTSEQAAEVLGVSTRTVDGDWAMARAWLRREMEPGQ